MEIILIAFALLLAASNGGNDVSKGIATLVGSGVTNYRRAILWGTLWTVLGGLAAAALALLPALPNDSCAESDGWRYNGFHLGATSVPRDEILRGGPPL